MRPPISRPTPARTVAAAALGLLLLAGASACAESDPETAADAGSQEEEGGGKSAAEPADAPELEAEPDGEVTEVAPRPEGLTYSEEQDALVVGVRDPDRLLVLDPDTLELRQEVPLPGKLRHLQVSKDGNTALLPIETANTLFQVDLASGDVVETLVDEYPHDAAGTDDGNVWVGNEFAGTISVVEEGEIVKTFEDLRQPGGVLVDGDTAVSVDVGEYTVTTYDVPSLSRTAQVAAGEGPTHGRLVGGGRLAVSDTRGDRVIMYTLDPLEEIGTLDLPGAPYGLAVDRESQTLWVTLTETNELVGLDVSGEVPREIERYATVRQPNTVVTTPGADTVWVTGRSEGVIQRIDR